jgi:hypothetical protein
MDKLNVVAIALDHQAALWVNADRQSGVVMWRHCGRPLLEA